MMLITSAICLCRLLFKNMQLTDTIIRQMNLLKEKWRKGEKENMGGGAG